MCHSIYILLSCYVSSYSLVKHSVNDPIYINMIMYITAADLSSRVETYLSLSHTHTHAQTQTHTHTHNSGRKEVHGIRRGAGTRQKGCRRKSCCWCAGSNTLERYTISLCHNCVCTTLHREMNSKVHNQESSLLKKWKLTCSPYWV
jgi:hypothetical protein